MNPGWSAAVTLIGLVIVICGIGCGVVAYVATVREHDELPIWPWVAGKVERGRALARSLRARSPVPEAQTVEPESIPSRARVGTPTFVVDPVPTLEGRIAWLEQRWSETAARAAAEQARLDQVTADLRRELVEQGHRLDAADDQLESLAKSAAVSTARQQLLGLILVGIGTVVMAVPAIAAAL